jgi:hypothetical protein
MANKPKKLPAFMNKGAKTMPKGMPPGKAGAKAGKTMPAFMAKK